MNPQNREPIGLEHLEPRQLLAADVGISIVDDQIPEFIVPGQRIELDVVLFNAGESPTAGQAVVQYFASRDEELDAGDTLLATVRRGGRLAAGGEAAFTDRFVVPQTLGLGSYILFARVNMAGDPDESNNLDRIDGPVPLILAFGAGENFRLPSLSFTTPEGTLVTARITGPGFGVFVADDDEGLGLLVESTDARTSVIITTARGANRLVLEAVEIEGSIRSFNARTTTVNGGMGVFGAASEVTLAALTNGRLEVGGGGAGLRLAIGTIANASIESGTGISSFTGTSWTAGEEEGDDSLSAPWLGTLNFRGNFGASLELSGLGAPRGLALNNATIGGALAGVSWEIGGLFGNITAGSVSEAIIQTAGGGRGISVNRGNADAVIFVNGGLNTFAVRGTFNGILAADGALNTFNAGFVGGPGEGEGAIITASGAVRTVNIRGSVIDSILAAAAFNAINIGGDMTGVVLLTGTYLGRDAGLGQREPGDPEETDVFGPGFINNLGIRGGVSGSLVAAGIRVTPDGDEDDFELEELDFVDGQSLIRNISIGRSLDAESRFVAKQLPAKVRVGAVAITTASDPRFLTQI